MNKLPLQTRVQILSMLCEGTSMGSISRALDVSINTVAKLLVDAGKACAAFHDVAVQGVNSSGLQVNRIWTFTTAKHNDVAKMKAPIEGVGDTWTWTAIDADTKLIVSWLVGGRDGDYALAFMDDLRSRLVNRVQLTRDGHRAYLDAVEGAFGRDVDYAQIVEIYSTGVSKARIDGNPDPKHVPMSYAERQNLTMRMHMRRFARLTNAFSKKFENHMHMVAIYTVWYNFVKRHKTLKGLSPAMAAGVSDTLWSVTDLAEMVDATMPKPGKRGSYKKGVEHNGNSSV